MAQVTASMVKELRERTGLGMMECKKALTEAGGDIDKAIDDLRKSGQAKAAKKAGRTAAEGIVVVETSDDNSYAVIVEVNSETDFVAKDESFLAFANKVAEAALASRPGDVKALMQLKFDDGSTVEEARQALIQKIGENIQVRRLEVIEATGGKVAAYVHGGKIGVVVSLEGGNDELGKDVAMHVAAVNPMVVRSEDVPEETLEKEKEIIRAQPDMSGKPDDIVEKMLVGRVKKFLKEISLLEQPFVKDPNISVGELVKQNNAAIDSFVRLAVGEGIEKKEEDFAAEVAAQLVGK